jgi:hypothetical protein
MGEAIGESLAAAVGIAISPIPIIAVVLMLTTPDGRANSTAFLLGWLLGLGAAGTAVLLIAAPVDGDDSGPAAWLGRIKILLGALLLFVAIRQFRRRDRVLRANACGPPATHITAPLIRRLARHLQRLSTSSAGTPAANISAARRRTRSHVPGVAGRRRRDGDARAARSVVAGLRTRQDLSRRRPAADR